MKKNKLPYALQWIVKHRPILNIAEVEREFDLPKLSLGTFLHNKFFPKKHEDTLEKHVDILNGNATMKICIDVLIEKCIREQKEFQAFKGEHRIKNIAHRQKENMLDVKHQQTMDNIIMIYKILHKENPHLAEYLMGRLAIYVIAASDILSAAVAKK